jgi:DNA-binding SARP family transcriptional activator
VTRGRGSQAAAGVVALLTLLALVAGLPVLLYRLGGSPLPGHLPGLTQVRHGLLHRESPGVFLAAVRDISWIAWAAFTLAVLAEAQAVLRRRTPPRLWLGGLQGAAARLVALAALTFTSTPVGTLLTTPQPVSAVTVAPQADVTAASAQVTTAFQEAAAPHTQTARDTAAREDATAARSGAQGMSMDFFQLVTVRPGDCLWTIAQRYLGSGDRYQEIVSLNLGHGMGNGQVFSDPSVIWPGWVLHLPAHGGGQDSGSQDSGSQGTGSQGTGSPGTAGGSQAGTHGGHQTRDRHFRHPHRTASANPAQSDPAQQKSAGPAGGRASTGSPARAASAAGTSLGAAQDNQMSLFLAFGGGILAGGAAVSLARLRHRQRQTRGRGRRIPLPASAPVTEAEQRLNLAAAQEPLTGLRGVLRYLAAELIAGGQQVPDITALLVRPESLDILLASPAAEPPPEPLTVPGGHQGMTWRLRLADELAEPADESGDLLPGLLAIGASADGYLLVDLEHLQVTTVSGPASRTAAQLRSAAAELATGQLAGWYDLILVGFPELAVLGGRATCCDTMDAGLDLLAAKAVALRRRLGPDADARYQRLADPADEDWALTLLVSSVPPTAGQLALLTDLAGDPGGIAALVPGGAEPPAGHREPASIDVTAAPDGGATIARIWPLQLEARCEPLDDSDYEALTSLFATATAIHDVGPADPPYDSWTWPPDVVEPGDDQADWADGDEWDQARPAAEVAGPGDETGDDEDWADEPVQVGTVHWAAPEWPGPDAAGSKWADWAGSGWAEPGPADAADEGAVLVQDRLMTDGLAGPGWPDPGPGPGSGPGQDGTEDGPAAPSWPDRPAWSEDPSVTGLPGRQEGTGQATAADPPEAGQPESPAAEPALRIGVLGTFTVNGQPGALLPAQSQLVLALALNSPSGLSNQQLCYLLGADPDRPKPSDSLRQLIVRTRRQLGRAPDGREWIEHLGGGQYALHPGARFDWAEFSALTTEGMRARDAGQLREALRLIRGQPFTGCYYWWLDLAVTETVRAQIVDAADVLAALETAEGDPAAAGRAARIGLAGDAAAEQLWRALMRAEHAAGNLTGVREAWNRCLDAISEIAPDGEPHPGTAALYRELLGSAPSRSARPAWAAGRRR